MNADEITVKENEDRRRIMREQSAHISEQGKVIAGLREEQETLRARLASAVVHIPDDVVCGDVRQAAEDWARRMLELVQQAEAAEAELAEAKKERDEAQSRLAAENYDYRERAEAAEAQVTALQEQIKAREGEQAAADGGEE